MQARLSPDNSNNSSKEATSGSQHPRSLLSPDSNVILERHRHRYEVNPAYIDRLTAEGLNFIGKDDKGVRMEIIELKDHPWYVGVQFHPEFLSRVLHPSRPILGFLAASAGCLEEVMGGQSKLPQAYDLVNGDSGP